MPMICILTVKILSPTSGDMEYLDNNRAPWSTRGSRRRQVQVVLQYADELLVRRHHESFDESWSVTEFPRFPSSPESRGQTEQRFKRRRNGGFV